MDYDKLDADLAAQLYEFEAATDRSDAMLSIFIETKKPPAPEEAAFLERLGVSGDLKGRDIFTATLSTDAIAELSSQPWVRYLKLSRKLRPLNKR
jgi:hypothetical protein